MPIGGYRASHDSGTVTVGNEAPLTVPDPLRHFADLRRALTTTPGNSPGTSTPEGPRQLKRSVAPDQELTRQLKRSVSPGATPSDRWRLRADPPRVLVKFPGVVGGNAQVFLAVPYMVLTDLGRPWPP